MPGREVGGDPVGKARWRNVPGAADRRRAWPPALITAVLLVGVAVFMWVRGRPAWAVALPLVMAFVMPLLILRSGGTGLAWVAKFALVVGQVVSRSLFTLLAVPLVMVPWLVQQMRPGAARTPPPSWNSPALRRGTAEVMWSNDRPDRPGLAGPITLAVVVLAVGALVIWTVVDEPSPGGGGFQLTAGPIEAVEDVPEDELREPVPPGVTEDTGKEPRDLGALDDQPWWFTGEYRDGMGTALDTKRARYENPYRILDSRSRWVNIVDGRRATWRPPTCDGCRLPVVWLYGGSTAFGLDQRDDHTIASELARVAHEHGIDLEVHNRGLPGFTHWQEAERFAWDLATEPAPDLVLFYDGVNEINMGAPDPDNSWSGKESPIDPFLSNIWYNSGRSRAHPPAREGAMLMPSTGWSPRGATERGISIVRRYDRVRKMSQLTAAAYGIPVVYVWQPSRYNRPLVPGEPHYDTDEENNMRLVTQAASDNVADDVINVADSLDHITRPVFTDDVHHNELAARVIAEAIFERIQGQLAQLRPAAQP